MTIRSCVQPPFPPPPEKIGEIFLRGGGRLYAGYCRIYYINLLLCQYGISVAETQTFLLYKSLTKQTVLQRNL